MEKTFIIWIFITLKDSSVSIEINVYVSSARNKHDLVWRIDHPIELKTNLLFRPECFIYRSNTECLSKDDRKINKTTDCCLISLKKSLDSYIDKKQKRKLLFKFELPFHTLKYFRIKNQYCCISWNDISKWNFERTFFYYQNR